MKLGQFPSPKSLPAALFFEVNILIKTTSARPNIIFPLFFQPALIVRLPSPCLFLSPSLSLFSSLSCTILWSALLYNVRVSQNRVFCHICHKVLLENINPRIVVSCIFCQRNCSISFWCWMLLWRVEPEWKIENVRQHKESDRWDTAESVNLTNLSLLLKA